jgi:[protein-PII] uridylyltransferase
LTFALRDAGRRTAHLLDSTWRRLGQLLGPATEAEGAPSSRRTLSRRPEIRPVDPTADAGVGRLGDEVVLTAAARPEADSLLALRAAALAAEQGLLLSRASADRLARSACPLPEPWPPAARRWLIRLLTSGPGLVPVWEELDQAGVVDTWLPEWSRIRLLSSSAAVHRWTVDRHSVQTVVNAAAAMRRVNRPDLLVVAALLHDIGKGRRVDHSMLGARLAHRVCSRWGFDRADADRVALLVRHHLLLPSLATRRDLQDPATTALVTGSVPDAATLDLLAVLTECDAQATGGAAWSRWRAGLVQQLASASRQALASASPPEPTDAVRLRQARALSLIPVGADLGGAPLRIDVVSSAADETRLQILAPDRLGLLADVAGGLDLAGLPVRGAHLWITPDGTAVSWWDVPVADVNTSRLGARLRQLLGGSTELRGRLAVGAASREAPPVVLVVPGASSTATVVEVRAQDRRGLVWAVCDVFARHRVDVRTAHLDTLGSQTYDVFYLVGPEGEALPDAVVAEVVADIERL